MKVGALGSRAARNCDFILNMGNQFGIDKYIVQLNAYLSNIMDSVRVLLQWVLLPLIGTEKYIWWDLIWVQLAQVISTTSTLILNFTKNHQPHPHIQATGYVN
jgi:hypothetical protein